MKEDKNEWEGNYDELLVKKLILVYCEHVLCTIIYANIVRI